MHTLNSPYDENPKQTSRYNELNILSFLWQNYNKNPLYNKTLDITNTFLFPFEVCYMESLLLYLRQIALINREIIIKWNWL